MRHSSKNNFQLIWGGALILMGVAVFFRTPQVIPKLVEMGQSATTIGFIRVSFYGIGIILIGGGMKKMINHLKPEEKESGDNTNEQNNID